MINLYICIYMYIVVFVAKKEAIKVLNPRSHTHTCVLISIESEPLRLSSIYGELIVSA